MDDVLARAIEWGVDRALLEDPDVGPLVKEASLRRKDWYWRYGLYDEGRLQASQDALMRSLKSAHGVE